MVWYMGFHFPLFKLFPLFQRSNNAAKGFRYWVGVYMYVKMDLNASPDQLYALNFINNTFKTSPTVFDDKLVSRNFDDKGYIILIWITISNVTEAFQN